MIKVMVVYSTKNSTWNIMKTKTECLEYGTITVIENWIEKNKNKYIAEWQDFRD